MIGVRVSITGWVKDQFPGWVECQLVDIHGRSYTFVEKRPILTAVDLDAGSRYPQMGVIACEVLERANGIASIDTNDPWDIISTDGQTKFQVPETQLVEWKW